MRSHEGIVVVISEWVEKAENDLKTAVHTLTMGDDCPTDTICFHAQQCVEKYLKALLVLYHIAFPKAHDIEALLVLLPKNSRPELSEKEQGYLTDYATVTRYPGDYEPITLAEARRVVAVARRVRKDVRKLLPRKALRRRKR